MGPGKRGMYIGAFLHFAFLHGELEFLVTEVGCGLAGYKKEEIAPLFAPAFGIPNVRLPESFTSIILESLAK